MYAYIVAPESQKECVCGKPGASKRGREEKQEVRLKRVVKEGTEGVSLFALPTCHSTVLAGCQSAPLQTQLHTTMNGHCPPQRVSHVPYYKLYYNANSL